MILIQESIRFIDLIEEHLHYRHLLVKRFERYLRSDNQNPVLQHRFPEDHSLDLLLYFIERVLVNVLGASL